MKIAIITDAWHPQVNGVVFTLDNVRKELEALGHSVLVINPSLFHTFPMPKYPEIRLAWLPGRKLRRVLSDFAPDAIHIATEGTLGLAARAYCRRCAHAFTTSYHTKYPQYVKRYLGIPESLTYRLFRWFHKPAACVLVPTPSARDELRDHGFINARVWSRGVDTSVFGPDDPVHYPFEGPIFLYVGRVAREKNIEAFLELDVPGTKVVVGDGPERRALATKFPDAKFLGYKHGRDLARHYAGADVFVFPSRTDTFGIVMLEAMACGLPVAAYPVTGPIDVVRPGATGVLDVDLRTASLEALKIDRGTCRDFAVAHSWRRCADILLRSLAVEVGRVPNDGLEATKNQKCSRGHTSHSVENCVADKSVAS